jgi:alpha-beta hydrolase superfamily lysophospholipase
MTTNMPNYSKLDKPEVLSRIFYPRQEERTPLAEYSCDFDCTVEENIVLGCRFHGASQEAPTLLFFHGNAETVSDYDTIAAKYVQHGMNLLVTTYRGYGWSTGSPTVSAMLLDTDIIFQKAVNWLEEKGYTGSIFAMGRSLGSASAIDLTERHQGSIKGLIIESGFADTMPLCKTLGIELENNGVTEKEGFGNCEKIAEIKIPTFILHGSSDTMIPVALAEKLQACCAARSKQFMVIPGADHNTMIATGGDKYFEVIKGFVDKTCGVTHWKYKRNKYKRPTS